MQWKVLSVMFVLPNYVIYLICFYLDVQEGGYILWEWYLCIKYIWISVAPCISYTWVFSLLSSQINWNATPKWYMNIKMQNLLYKQFCFKFCQNISWNKEVTSYSRTSMARTLMAHLPRLARTDIMVPTGHFMHNPPFDGWNYPWLELFFMVPSLFEPLKFYLYAFEGVYLCARKKACTYNLAPQVLAT